MIPSIDLMGGRAVQLVGGRELAIDAGDPIPFIDTFGLVGEVAVVDLDAALGKGSNTDVIRGLLRRAPCRVGGGIRDARSAIDWLEAGAHKVVLGTAANVDVLRKIPKQRVIAALDAYRGDVVVEGWRRKTGIGVEQRMQELRDDVGEFLVTFVEREGRLQGVDLERIADLVRIAGDVPLTIAGGISTPGEVAAVDKLGARAQVGMAIYSGRFDLTDALVAMLRSDREDGTWPTVVVDPSGVALGLVYSNEESLRAAIKQKRGVYWSRKRGLWIKGETSGATQDLIKIDLDCDRDALRFSVRQREPGFCHTGRQTCWGAEAGFKNVFTTLRKRSQTFENGSYTRQLLEAPNLLRAKLLEEAAELAAAESSSDVAHEAADVMYFTFVAMVRAGVSLEDIAREFDRRSLVVTRRSELAGSGAA